MGVFCQLFPFCTGLELTFVLELVKRGVGGPGFENLEHSSHGVPVDAGDEFQFLLGRDFEFDKEIPSFLWGGDFHFVGAVGVWLGLFPLRSATIKH